MIERDHGVDDHIFAECVYGSHVYIIVSEGFGDDYSTAWMS